MKRRFYSEEYKQWRKDILKRDKKTCQMPGCKSKSRLQVHHIEKWSTASSLRYEISNGITLCRNCHDSIRGKECHYVTLFKTIIG